MKNIFNLENKVALVTGGFGHLGKAITEVLLEYGAKVIVASRNYQDIFAGKVVFVKTDINDEDSIKNLFNYVNREYQKVDILVNNAFSSEGASFYEGDTEKFTKTLKGTLTSVYSMIKLFVPIMTFEDRTSSIINIASIYGVVSQEPKNYLNYPDYENPCDYGVAKAGVIQLTKYAATKFAPKNIRVNAISPGAFPNLKELPQGFAKDLEKRIPLNRIGLPEELKGVILLLASHKASSYITGQNIIVDGGWTTW